MKLSSLPAFAKLKRHYEEIKDLQLRDLFAKEDDRGGQGYGQKRGQKYFLRTGPLSLDYSKNRITDETLALLFELAEESGLAEARRGMFAGERINFTEHRAALHTALRRQAGELVVEGVDVMRGVREVLEKMGSFSDALRSGAWLGYTGQIISDVVNIGIGGSDLGALMVCKALKKFSHPRLNIFFVSNVDGTQLENVLAQVHPETTLFIVASKTFSTQETLTNALTARQWFIAHAGEAAHVARHFVAVSTNHEAVRDFGIDLANMFEFWDWVGGRYSLWSAIGLSIMIYLGRENFARLLAGAAMMDEHFLHAPLAENMPVILALLGIWYVNFFDAGSHLIAPYDSLLRYFPKFIQQLDMESNGKGVSRNGSRVDYDTGPIIWGDMGINAQHAFFQLLHQGTHLSPIDFIASLSERGTLREHHQILLSNVFAQAEAFMRGRSLAEVEEEMRAAGVSEDEIAHLAPHRVFTGNRPSNVLLLDEISPESVGALIALYEHKIFVQGVIWDINSFDQWGVELGKELAKKILNELQGGPPLKHDSSTSHLIEIYKNFNQS